MYYCHSGVESDSTIESPVITDNYYVYLASNRHNNVLYVGVTNDICRRITEHKQKLYQGFTYKYNINKLVYYESFHDITDAIYREKRRGTI